MLVAEMQIIWYICGHTRLDRIKNQMITNKTKVEPIDDNTREIRLIWYDNVKMGSADAPVR